MSVRRALRAFLRLDDPPRRLVGWRCTACGRQAIKELYPPCGCEGDGPLPLEPIYDRELA